MDLLHHELGHAKRKAMIRAPIPKAATQECESDSEMAAPVAKELGMIVLKLVIWVKVNDPNVV